MTRKLTTWGAALLGALALAGGAEAAGAEGRTIELTVTEKGFVPTPVKVKAGEALTLVVTRKTDRTCAKDLVIPDEKISVKLPLGEPVRVAFTPSKTGELRYGCGMNQMVGGVLVVE